MGKKTDIEGMIFKIKRFSIHDGPGIRTTIFLKGCPLSCIWCHSPEGISRDITIWHNSSSCISCGTCVNACPESALLLTGKVEAKVEIDRDRCIPGDTCVNVCPTGSLQFTGRKASVAEMLNEIEKDKLYYNESGGGVTLTGGEPFAQPEFAYTILKACYEGGINTAVETSLFCDQNILEKFTGVTRLFIADIKIFDPHLHMTFTGVSNEIILDNFRYLAGLGKDIIVRIPIVPGITDTDENIKAITEFVNSIDPAVPVEMIKYNTLAPNNYRRLNLTYLV